jgi:hypothetical protein
MLKIATIKDGSSQSEPSSFLFLSGGMANNVLAREREIR